jgi:hypothetical protein
MIIIHVELKIAIEESSSEAYKSRFSWLPPGEAGENQEKLPSQDSPHT